MKGKTIIMDSRTEEILKRCSSIEAIKGLSDEEKELLREQADKNDRMQCNNDFLGSNRNVKFFTFNLPRKLACPGRTDICARGCYQAISEEMLKEKGRDSQVLYSRKLNWFLAEQDDFVERILKEIMRRKPKADQRIIFRIHASGDFYSEEYLKKWMKIALITKLKNKNYDFVAYTKSYSELNNVLSNQAGLWKLYQEAYNAAKIAIPQEKELSLADFNLNIIASYMDDTEEEKKRIAEKWNLPVYFVTEDNSLELTDCEADPCSECLKCYTFPMENVVTRLR
ncbi:GP88 family protein [Roseburia inulinivorans]